MKKTNTPQFERFIAEIKDVKTKAIVLARISGLLIGKVGNTKSVGDGVLELKIDYGPGWRVYYTKVGEELILLLTGGTKTGQQQDIEAAKKLIKEFIK